MTYTEAVEMARKGETTGFDFLYNSTKSNKYYLALKYVRNEETAKDVLQEAYIRAWKNLDRLKEPEKFDSWLSQIVVNTAKNELEKRNHTPLDLRADSGEDEDDTEIFDRAVSSWDNVPELEYTKEETRQLVHELIDSLSDEQRLVVIAFELEGLTTKEIAEQLGCSEATVKSRLRYGRNNIKEKAEELQKKGYKLYSFAPVPLLLALLQKEQAAFATEVSTEAALMECANQVLKKAAFGKVVKTQVVTGKIAKNTFLTTKMGKITVGIVAATAVGATTTAAIVLNQNNQTPDIEVVKEIETMPESTGDETGSFDRTAAEDVWTRMNEERVSAGLDALAWDESIYDFACERAQQIVTDFSHNGCGSYGENIQSRTGTTYDGQSIHAYWSRSSEDHENYLSDAYGSGACAVYVYDGMTYAVQDFAQASDQDAQTTTEADTETPGTESELVGEIENGTLWTASNGVTLFIRSDGLIAVLESDKHTPKESKAALDEYYATH